MMLRWAPGSAVARGRSACWDMAPPGWRDLGRHNVPFQRSARKTLHYPPVGDIEPTGDALELPGQASP